MQKKSVLILFVNGHFFQKDVKAMLAYSIYYICYKSVDKYSAFKPQRKKN